MSPRRTVRSRDVLIALCLMRDCVLLRALSWILRCARCLGQLLCLPAASSAACAAPRAAPPPAPPSPNPSIPRDRRYSRSGNCQYELTVTVLARGLILKRLRSFRLEPRNGLLVGAEISPPRSASAKLMPSAEMPKPENIRRIVTGPKSANRSIRKSRSMRPARRQPVRAHLVIRCGHLRGAQERGLG